MTWLSTRTTRSANPDEHRGIEFVNRDWLSSTTKDGGEGIPAHEAALTADQKAKYAEAKGHIWTFWGYGFGIYKLPPDLAQLEKEVELLSWLTDSLQATINSAPPQFQSMFPWFEKTWLQLVSYNDVKDKWTFPADHIPAAADQATKNLFVYTTGWDVLLPAQISGKRGSSPQRHLRRPPRRLVPGPLRLAADGEG